MDDIFCRLPVDFGALINGKHINLCSNKESIDSNIHLILVTPRGKYLNDPDFGCRLWDRDFEITNEDNPQAELERSIKNSLEKYEKRLENVKITVSLEPPEKNTKRKITVKVDATMTEDNQIYPYVDEFYFSPLSFD